MAPKNVLIVAMALISANFAMGQKIIEVRTNTGRYEGAQMDKKGFLDLLICQNLRCCQIKDLNNKHNNFEKGYIDKFRGPNLKTCQNFPMTPGALGMITVSQS